MICLLNCLHETEDRARVGIIHYKPERLAKAQRQAGITLDITEQDIPRPKRRRGESAMLYFNPQTREFWYEYAARSLTQEELLESIVERLDAVIERLDKRG